MTDEGWQIVKKRQRPKKKKYILTPEERQKWNLLEIKYPHMVLPQRALRIRRKLNIDKLDIYLLSDEWINYQKDNWRYDKVLKAGTFNEKDIEKTVNILILDLENGWGDKVLFTKIIS